MVRNQNPKAVFPDGKQASDLFARARQFFAKCPDVVKMRRAHHTIPNSMIKYHNEETGKDEILMIAATDKETHKGKRGDKQYDVSKNPAYVGKGGQAFVKYAKNEAGELFALRIVPAEEVAKQEVEIGKKTGLIKGVATREKDQGETQYQVQKLGVSLEKFLETPESKTLTEDQRLLIAIRLSQKVQELHDMGYAHLDIKPGNIIINKDTLEITLIDFGFAQEKNKKEPNTTRKYSGTSVYQPNTEALRKSSLEDRDIHALVKTILFPFRIRNTTVDSRAEIDEYYFYCQTHCILNSKHDRGALYEEKEDPQKSGYKILTPKKFQSCNDLALTLITERHEKDALPKDFFQNFNTALEKKFFIENYQAALDHATRNKTSLTPDDLMLCQLNAKIQAADTRFREVKCVTLESAKTLYKNLQTFLTNNSNPTNKALLTFAEENKENISAKIRFQWLAAAHPDKFPPDSAVVKIFSQHDKLAEEFLKHYSATMTAKEINTLCVSSIIAQTGDVADNLTKLISTFSDAQKESFLKKCAQLDMRDPLQIFNAALLQCCGPEFSQHKDIASANKAAATYHDFLKNIPPPMENKMLTQLYANYAIQNSEPDKAAFKQAMSVAKSPEERATLGYALKVYQDAKLAFQAVDKDSPERLKAELMMLKAELQLQLASYNICVAHKTEYRTPLGFLGGTKMSVKAAATEELIKNIDTALKTDPVSVVAGLTDTTLQKAAAETFLGGRKSELCKLNDKLEAVNEKIQPKTVLSSSPTLRASG